MSEIKIDIELSGLSELQRLTKKASKLGNELEKTIEEISKLKLNLEVRKPNA